MKYRRNYSDEAIVLARRNYSEADRIVTLYTKHFGKVRFLAKGVRKLQSRKKGSLEIFSYIKFSAISKSDFNLLTETNLLDGFSLIRKSLQKASVAYFFCETILKLTQEEEKSEKVFELFLNYLKKLTKFGNLRNLRYLFIKEILVLTGFWPKEKKILNPDVFLEEVMERKMGSLRVGKRIFS